MAGIILSKHLLLRCFLMSVCFEMLLGKAVVSQTEKERNVTSPEKKYYDLIDQLEKTFKNTIKSVTRSLLPSMMTLREESNITSSCTRSLMKYVVGLTKAKLWAAKMLDATSKLPSGILYGTFADFGAFDECLSVKVFQKNGSLEFAGQSCAVEAKPPLPPLPEKFSLAKVQLGNPEDTLGSQFRNAYQALHHKSVRLMICVPSTCSLQDMRIIADSISRSTDFEIKLPKCYIKETPKLLPVHIATITSLAILLLLCIIGTVVESRCAAKIVEKQTMTEKVLIAFSLSSNFKRLISASGGSTELQCIHGIRALGMCWIILGHSYVFTAFELSKEPFNIQRWFNSYEFELIHNGWLSVETFFLLSGILVSYSGLRSMGKTKGIINVPLLALRRYVRLTPPLLLLMGLVFFMPLVSSGPFYYEQVDPQVESCQKYWWTTLLYFSNWWGIDKGCILTTWYLSADFQLHIVSLIILMVIYRYSKVGVSILFSAVACSCIAVGILTAVNNLTPTIQLSTGDNQKVFDALNTVHIHTFTHLGPHCIGMILGYYIYQYKEKKLNKVAITIGWCLSIVFSISALVGGHRFAIGDEQSTTLALLYASVHRSVFIAGVGWVAFACIKGCGGIVNKLLSSAVFAPPSRLTFMVYLIHPLVIWVKIASQKEKVHTSHYDFVYIYIANAVTSFVLAVPFYLILEAPLANLDRLVFMKHQKSDTSETEKQSLPAPQNDVQLVAVNRFTPQPRPFIIDSRTERQR